jgi:hypothetical protein
MSKKNRGTPSLKPGAEWKPTSKPSPFRNTITSQQQFQPELNVDEERDLKWLNPTKGVRLKTVEKRAR